LLIWFFIGIPLMFLLVLVGGYLSAQNAPGWIFPALMVLPVLLIVFLFVFPAIKALTSNTFLGAGAEARRILQTGYPATATVLQIGESSEGGVVTINEQPYLNLKLLVEDGRHKPYEVGIDALIPRTAIPQFQPGVVFKVKVDPNNPQKVVIDTNNGGGK
jgi:hypothetical protein